jgi:hypothetical protein
MLVVCCLNSAILLEDHWFGDQISRKTRTNRFEQRLIRESRFPLPRIIESSRGRFSGNPNDGVKVDWGQTSSANRAFETSRINPLLMRIVGKAARNDKVQNPT